MLNERTDTGIEILNTSKSRPTVAGVIAKTDQTFDRNIAPAPRCPFHGRYNMPCSSPLMREIEAVSKYVLQVQGVKPNYVENIKRFKETVRPESLCYSAYMRMLDRLAAYAETLQARQRGGPLRTEQNVEEHKHDHSRHT